MNSLNLREAGTRIELSHIEKRFGAQRVLHGISLTAAPGELIAIVGKSGCGKSTLLRLIAGLETPDSGEIQINGQSPKGLDSQTRVMFQDARLLPWKRVRDNVALGLKGEARDRAQAALEYVGLPHKENAWPSTLSGGERQRVALARALVTQPRLLLLDEPLGALDALTRIEMQYLIERLWKEENFTALLVTHDVEEAVALADRVILLEQGLVTLDLRIDLPRPRHRGSREFGAIKEQLLEAVLGYAPFKEQEEEASLFTHAIASTIK